MPPFCHPSLRATEFTHWLNHSETSSVKNLNVPRLPDVSSLK